MDFEIFENLVKDALTNMFDYAALETHPLIDAGIKPPTEYKGSRSDYLKSVLLECINSLKPRDINFDFFSIEWRSYIILSQRYLENVSSPELAKKLLLGERQIRRSQKKAIRAVALVLWDRIHALQDTFANKTEANSFVINREVINLNQVVQSILDLFQNNFERESVVVDFDRSQDTLTVNSDRIILRQIIIRIFNLLLQETDCRHIQLSMEQPGEDVHLLLNLPGATFEMDQFLTFLYSEENQIHQWLNELNMRLEGMRSPQGFQLMVCFIGHEKKLILVVDDQEPALKLYERYLSKTNYKIYGLSKATKVLHKAIELNPALILLDIMMPKLDGWEILQSLRLNEKTKHIPIIVCSAWGEPELAKSLGANYFLRKPIVQKELLEILENVIEL
ncbi:MAG: response regulator [Anaerolineaceae bacterium]|nr:response regulator [Anaerolineaceae bacterium]